MKVGPLTLKLIFWFIKKQDLKRRATWPSPERYDPIYDVDALGDGNFFHQFDVFRAPKEIRNGCTLIDIHGGAYIYGDRKNNFGYASVFLNKGYDVVLLDYEHNGKGRDCRDQVRALGAELRYLRDHVSELGLQDPNQWLLTGDSAGGHFALLLAEASCDCAFSAQLGLDLQGISFLGVALSCPVYDFVRATASPSMSRGGLRATFGKAVESDEYRRLLCPRIHIGSLKIPLFLNTCRNDFLLQESLDLKNDMDVLAKEISYVYVDKEDKAIQHVHNVTEIQLVDSMAVNGAMASFFDECRNAN